MRLLVQAPVALPRLLAQALVALPRRFTEILCPDFVVISRYYTKYYRKTTPRQSAKFTRKSLLFNYAVLPIYLTESEGFSFVL